MRPCVQNLKLKTKDATCNLLQTSYNVLTIKYQHYKDISLKLIRAEPPSGGSALRARNDIWVLGGGKILIYLIHLLA